MIHAAKAHFSLTPWKMLWFCESLMWDNVERSRGQKHIDGKETRTSDHSDLGCWDKRMMNRSWQSRRFPTLLKWKTCLHKTSICQRIINRSDSYPTIVSAHSCIGLQLVSLVHEWVVASHLKIYYTNIELFFFQGGAGTRWHMQENEEGKRGKCSKKNYQTKVKVGVVTWS